MATTVTKAVLWRRELQNHPGTLAKSLKPLAQAKINLKVIMGYTYSNDTKAALEVWPIENSRSKQAAVAAGLSPTSKVPCLIVEGDDRFGLGHNIANALAGAHINLSFAIMQSIGKRYQGVFGFDTNADAARAVGIIKLATQTGSKHKADAKPKAGKAMRKPSENKALKVTGKAKRSKPKSSKRK